MTRKTAVATAALAALLLAPLTGCSDSLGSGETGRLSILLTDAPGDVHAAVVTISQVYLQGEGGRVVLTDEETTTDLLTLVDATEELVTGAAVPAGTYAQLRFVVTGAYIEVEDADGGTSIYASSSDYAGLPDGADVAGELQLPSLAASGLKVTLPDGALTIDADESATLVADFDVAQSFGHATGQAGGWVMHPVIIAEVGE